VQGICKVTESVLHSCDATRSYPIWSAH